VKRVGIEMLENEMVYSLTLQILNYFNVQYSLIISPAFVPAYFGVITRVAL
jgi:hypothetical protein